MQQSGRLLTPYLHQWTDHPERKINKETQALNETLDQKNQIIPSKTEEYIFFSIKNNLSKFKKTEIASGIFPSHNAVRLGINHKGKTAKNTNIWSLNNTLLNNQQITEEIKEEVRILLETSENKNTVTQSLWDTENSSKREIDSNTALPQERRKLSNNLTLGLK